MNQIIRSLMSRKSVRSFTEQEIPEDIKTKLDEYLLRKRRKDS